MTSVLAVLVGLAVVGLGARANGADDTYLIGTGRYDVTGPAAEVEMMGYAMPTQITHGIHFRQWSRAFIIADSSDTSRVVFVNVDICMGTQILKMQVVEKLKALYGDLYTNDNVLISGIHTHSGPAGYFQYLLFEVMSLGFVKESLDAIVGGVVASIQEAHESRQPGKLYLNSGLLAGANINRSPAAYVRNPKEERMK
jgi:neutral ceramidase